LHILKKSLINIKKGDMMKQLFTFLLIILNIAVFSQVNKKFQNNYAFENGTANMVKSGIVYYYSSVLLDTSRRVPGLTSWSDYWTNGNNQRKVVVLGDTVIVCNEILDSLTAQTLTARKIFYQVSFDGGLTWYSEPVPWLSQSNSYPDMWPVMGTAGRTITISGREYLTPSGSRGYTGIDVTLGAGSVTSTLLPIGGDYFTWPFSSNQHAGINQSGDTLLFRKFNFITSTYDAPQVLAMPPTDITAGARKMIAASTNGQNIFVLWFVNEVGSEKISGRLSTDGGTTFGANQTIMQTGYSIGGDVMQPWVSFDLIYKPNSTNVCAAFNVVPAGNSVREYKILFWSPGINGGNPVKIADYTNTPYLSDTTWAFNSTASLQVNNTYISHPTLAYSSDGSRLVCAFNVAQKDSIFYSGANVYYLFLDVMSSYSTDDGATWSAPVRVTNTSAQDEIYPTLAKTGNTPGNFGILYQTSGFPGSSSFNQTTTPTSRNWSIYLRYDPVTGNPIGLKTISSEVPKSFSLEQNYPNPFNPSTNIRFNVSEKSNVTIKVYNTLGEVVDVLLNNQAINAGTHEVTFSGSNFASGVYFYTLETSEFRDTKKMILVK
ncbi:MAG TPA: T9SS type A sorting domain-containing protein, partial [Ignavibacteria bacterium]|nr:T9SS type A sorting domain-containing protein [Ignavibacteria bacterium]